MTTVFRFKGVQLDTAKRRLLRDGVAQSIEPKAFELLLCLLRHRDRAVGKDELFQALWPGLSVSEHALTSLVKRARQALGKEAAGAIATVRGFGYRFAATIDEGPATIMADGGRNLAAPAGEPAPTRGPVAIVGRNLPLRKLRDALQQSQEGRGGLAMIVGEPGIGKTCLAEELCSEAAAAGFEVMRGRCQDAAGQDALWPWVQLMRSFAARRDDVALAAALGSEAADIDVLTGAVRTRLPQLPSPMWEDPGVARARLLDAVTTVLERAAADRPMLLFIDDVQWADPASLAVLRSTATRAAKAAILVVAVWSTVDPQNDARLLPPLARLSGPLMIELGGLAASDAKEMLETRTGATVDATIAEAVTRVSGGNPFLLQEYWAYLLERQMVELRDVATDRQLPAWMPTPRWPGGDGALGGEVPGAARRALEQRLARLSDEQRRVLLVAAALGGSFRFDTLGLASGHPEESLADVVAAARQARILIDDPGTVGSIASGGEGPDLAFTHPWIRDALYRSLSTPERAVLHRRIASAIEAALSSRQPAHDPGWITELAHHRALGSDSSTAMAAIESGRAAAALACSRFAYESAAEHLERALAVLDRHQPGSRDERDRLRGVVLLELADARYQGGATELSLRAARQAVEVARGCGDSVALAGAAICVARHYWPRFVRSDEGPSELLDEAFFRLGDDHPDLRAQLLCERAVALHARPSGAAQARVAAAFEAVRLARLHAPPSELAHVMHDVQWALWEPEWNRQRLSLSQELLALAETFPELSLRARAWNLHNLFEEGQLDRLAAGLPEYARQAERSRQVRHQWYAARFGCSLATMRGTPEEAEEHFARLAALGPSVDANFGALIAAAHRVGVSRITEDWAETATDLVTIAERYPAVAARWTLPLALLGAGRSREARAALRALPLSDATALPVADGPNAGLGCRICIADAVVALGDSDKAAVLFDEMQAHRERWAVMAFAGASLGPISRPLARLAAILQRWADAEQLFAMAIDACERAGAPVELARTLIDHAAALRAQGKPGDARRLRQLLERARQLAAAHGLRRWRERIDSLAIIKDERRVELRGQDPNRRTQD